MSVFGKRIVLFSTKDPRAAALQSAVGPWGCLVTTCSTIDELRAQLEGVEHDLVVCEPSNALRGLIRGDETADIDLPLAEIEKRHINRVVASTGGNKTRAARILGIDTKTLYNKLKSYKASEQNARRRAEHNAALTR